MKEDIYMPRLGQTMKEGTVEKWLVEDGTTVEKSQPIVEISTDKVTNEIGSPADGILKIKAEAGSTLPIGEVIGEISSD